jgi:hypothetical protein
VKKYEILNKTKFSFFSTTVVAEVTQTVTSVQDSSIELAWHYDTVRLIDSMPKEPGEMRKPSMQLLLNGKTIKYRTDQYGRITDILNMNELSNRLKPAVDSTSSSFTRSMMPQYFANFLLKDLLVFHRMYGQRLKSNDTTRLTLNYSIKPDISFPAVKISANIKSKKGHLGDVLGDFISIEGRFIGYSSMGITNSFTYEYQMPSNWLTSYTNITEMVVHDALTTNEYIIKLIP